jgi:hypothetical protein
MHTKLELPDTRSLSCIVAVAVAVGTFFECWHDLRQTLELSHQRSHDSHEIVTDGSGRKANALEEIGQIDMMKAQIISVLRQ